MLFKVVFRVLVPAGTDKLYLTGSHPALGSWSADGIRLECCSDNFTAAIELPTGEYEYKYTRGSWDTVEKGKSGEELKNRRLIVKTGMVKDDDVLAFADNFSQPGTVQK
ncbi:MAG: CBM20 domain-containing protein [Candidatus Wallbacteria bacterium]|nr:CBM20 domain-containing protein [Candidatus Wallbacteria bacterium]